MNGIIIKILSNDYTVKLENNEYLVVKARGVFRNQKITPLVGDNVEITINSGDHENTIDKIYERKRIRKWALF